MKLVVDYKLYETFFVSFLSFICYIDAEKVVTWKKDVSNFASGKNPGKDWYVTFIYLFLFF